MQYCVTQHKNGSSSNLLRVHEGCWEYIVCTWGFQAKKNPRVLTINSSHPCLAQALVSITNHWSGLVLHAQCNSLQLYVDVTKVTSNHHITLDTCHSQACQVLLYSSLWLLTDLLEMLVCLLWFLQKADFRYGLLCKCELKMAGYWPSSFYACLLGRDKIKVHTTHTKKGMRQSCPKTSLVNKGFIIIMDNSRQSEKSLPENYGQSKTGKIQNVHVHVGPSCLFE